VLTRSVEEELALVVAGSTGVTWVLMSMAGTFAGGPFETGGTSRAAKARGSMLYTRTWHHEPDRGWRVLAAHISPVGG
jgi:hypothetical protein